jgi:hypothetical protein
MEMPVQLIITLFIVLVVGTLVINFSQDLIGAGKNSILGFFGGDKKPPTGADLIDVTSVSDREVVALIKECYNKNYGVNLHSGICFTVHSNEPYNIVPENLVALVGDVNVLGNVEKASVKTFFINWNVDKGKVEVKT